MKKRLQTIIAHAGVASRRGAVELIEAGKVKVDNRVITEKGMRIDPAEHEISVNGRPLPKKEKKYYFLFNKPDNVISTAIDTHGREKVTDHFKHINARLYPVGRLDKDTTGLLIVTNDGDLTHRLTHPRFGIEKEYLVTVDGDVARESVKKLERGIELDGKRTAPCEIKTVKKINKGMVLRVKLHEGRKRQIKYMFESVGNKVTGLKRVRYAGLSLGRLEKGGFRELSGKEVERLKSLAG